MTQIGTFKQTGDGYTGRIHTLTFDAELWLMPVKNEAENAPDFRIFGVSGSQSQECLSFRVGAEGDRQRKGRQVEPETRLRKTLGPEVGAAWWRRSDKAGDYLSCEFDDPLFGQLMRSSLFQSREHPDLWSLHWNRPTKRQAGEQGEERGDA